MNNKFYENLKKLFSTIGLSWMQLAIVAIATYEIIVAIISYQSLNFPILTIATPSIFLFFFIFVRISWNRLKEKYSITPTLIHSSVIKSTEFKFRIYDLIRLAFLIIGLFIHHFIFILEYREYILGFLSILGFALAIIEMHILNDMDKLSSNIKSIRSKAPKRNKQGKVRILKKKPAKK